MNPKEYPFYKWNVFETKHFILGQDWEAPIPGFFIVEPKRKTMKSILDMSAEEYTDFADVLLKGRRIMKEALGIETVYLFQEEIGDWFHVWMLPRYAWMNKFGESIESIRPAMEHAKEKRMTKENITEVKDAVEKARRFAKEKNWQGVNLC
jgi:diadenosine tetraphosphate (Ap4A) HIT family hydrolase